MTYFFSVGVFADKRFRSTNNRYVIFVENGYLLCLGIHCEQISQQAIPPDPDDVFRIYPFHNPLGIHWRSGWIIILFNAVNVIP